MDSTSQGCDAPYLGVDLTDRHAKTVRPIDVCGLRPDGDRLRASYWQWLWSEPEAALDVDPLLPEVRAARAVMVDGPQARARPGERVRVCERRTASAAKTPDQLPPLGHPYAGFVRSSLELFAAFHRAGLSLSPDDGLGLCEVYPASLWIRLAGRGLAKKTTPAGRRARHEILAELGIVGIPSGANHDQLDATVGALVAAAADGHARGPVLERLGDDLVVDGDGVLREGPMFAFERRPGESSQP